MDFENKYATQRTVSKSYAGFTTTNQLDSQSERENALAKKSPKDFIPCMILKYPGGSSKIFVYFHANAEDLGRAYKFLQYIHTYLRVHILAVEYPGYGVY